MSQSRAFSPNSSFLYAITAIVILFIAGQSVFFLIRAWKRAKGIGISAATLRKTVISSAIYTIAPAISILLGVIALSKSLGLPLPWLRLSVIGAITYETAAAAAATSALGLTLGNLITDAEAFVSITWVMTIGIMLSLILVVALTRKIENGIDHIRTQDEKWSGDLDDQPVSGNDLGLSGVGVCQRRRRAYGMDTRVCDACSDDHHGRLRCADEGNEVEMAVGLRAADFHARQHGAVHTDHQSCEFACAVRRRKNGLQRENTHRYGRFWVMTAIVLLLLVPIAIGIYYQVLPDFDGLWRGLLGVVPIFWTVGAIEVLTYTPMLGAGGTYLAFITGNLTNLKVPCVLNALQSADAKQGTEEAEVLSTIAVAVSSFVTMADHRAGRAAVGAGATADRIRSRFSRRLTTSSRRSSAAWARYLSRKAGRSPLRRSCMHGRHCLCWCRRWQTRSAFWCRSAR